MQREQLIRFVEDDYPRVLAALSYACGDRGRAEDAVQDALATACQHEGEILNPRAWVTTVALNEARTRVRRLASEQRANERAAVMRQTPTVPGSERLDDSVLDELRRLPERQREIVGLHYLLDMSVADVAEVLGVTSGTVKTQLHRARETLRTRLSSEHRTQEETDHVG